MAKHKLATSLRRHGEHFRKGDSIELTEEEAQAFGDAGYLADVPQPTKGNAKGRAKGKPAAAPKDTSKGKADNEPTADELNSPPVV